MNGASVVGIKQEEEKSSEHLRVVYGAGAVGCTLTSVRLAFVPQFVLLWISSGEYVLYTSGVNSTMLL